MKPKLQQKRTHAPSRPQKAEEAQQQHYKTCKQLSNQPQQKQLTATTEQNSSKHSSMCIFALSIFLDVLRLNAIFYAPDIVCAGQDDQTLPSIPITPIEEEDQPDPSPDSIACPSATTKPYPLVAQGGTLAAGVAGCGQADALKAALTAVAKSNEQIDHNLLVKILSNPTILEQLVRHQGPQSIPKPLSSGAPVYRMHTPAPPPPQYNNMETGSSSSPMMMSNGLVYPYTNGTGPMTHQQSIPPLSIQSGSGSQMKDLNYYKNLIHQHGGERQGEPQPQPQAQPPFSTHPIPIHHSGIIDQEVDNSKPRDAKHKIMKPCIYFNSSKGCRHGANSIYQHDMSLQQRVSSISEMQSAKRMKMDREIRGPQSYI
ncbi:zinc finger CCCH domain-containing protein 6-like [Spinacia oleracea]|uniref:Zinc finger CCCH domain-containing protein 6-like n=1 Tax=Spinacia oleracea TaxID=3562 RepID=A0A9R0ISL5_SPIOL|nr:zinc finger CCCH domain-containing protein 6-like [Spinacia oleracea]